MTDLKKIRIDKRLSQQDAAKLLGVSLRSYITYENNAAKTDSLKYRFFLRELEQITRIDEEHGILQREDIIRVCGEIFSEYDVDYCYLFGSYAKGKAVATSDVDLLISGKVTGLKYYEMVERLREGLCKKVDALDFRQLLNNEELLNAVLKEGIKIYG
ncbi:MAG: nucleotidyltransferase domain-containing protein [Lachnospiraceae bacterium]|nr:nucleotidyltransferase domain-containing protein [Lachnospiraceae bacterium]MBR5732635.1 nucleotidyltransferase domain-containing protein [Lachnospiraceae bacterium]